MDGTLASALGWDVSVVVAFLAVSVVATVILLFSGVLDTPLRRGGERDDDAIDGLWADDVEA